MRFWVGFLCGIVFGILLGGYGAAFLFFDEYMNSPAKAVKQVPALPAEQIPTSQGGFAPSLTDKPLEKIIEEKERKDQAKKQKQAQAPIAAPDAVPTQPAAVPAAPAGIPAESVDPDEVQ